MEQESTSQSLTKKESWELRRQEKQKRKEENISTGQRRKIVTRIGLAVLLLVIVAVGYGISRLPRGTEIERPGVAIPDQGRQHISIGANHPPYNSNPPTSGSHYAQPAAWGVYNAELPDEQLIHNLEHGGVWISYTNIDDATKSALEKLVRSQSKVIMEPRAKGDAPIVLASWNRLLKLQQFDEQVVLGFIEANRNQSPEPLAQ